MELTLDRKGLGKADKDLATVSDFMLAFIKVVCLEDDYDEFKVKGHTRIPEGRYEIKLRTEGRIHEAYKVRFPEFHKGVLHLQDVPNYQYVYIHCGTKAEDTEGCLLLALHKVNDNLVSDSEKAYRVIAPIITYLLENGEQVFINIKD